MCSPYYPLHDGQAACIKGRCVDNAVWLDGQRWCTRQPEVQSKVDVLGGPPVTAAEAVVQAEHPLNLARPHDTDRENGYENRSPVFSYELSPICIVPHCENHTSKHPGVDHSFYLQTLHTCPLIKDINYSYCLQQLPAPQ